MSKRKEKKYYPYQVPEELALGFEKEATQRRKTTGESITWSGIVREVLENYIAGRK